MSFPFYGQQFTFTQPDGSTLDVRGWGDQHHAVFETLDGYTVVENPASGFYEYAIRKNGSLKPSTVIPSNLPASILNIDKGLRESRSVVKAMVLSNLGLPPGNPRWKQRLEQAKIETLNVLRASTVLPAPPQRQTTGNYIGLCLLIQFPDVPGTISLQDVEHFCNQPGYSGYRNNGSVYDYFFDNSDGKLQYRNIIAPYYTAKYPRAYYTNEAVPQPIRATELIEEALAFHLSQGFSFSGLTVDNEQYVYALNVFYAGNVVNKWAKGLWPHSYYLNAPFALAPGSFAYDYQITNMGDELSLGVFCHENGHMICDFPDLYDYGPESRGVGDFCLMCYGGNADLKNPAQVGAYLKYKAGWASKLTTLQPGVLNTITAGQNDFFIHRKNSTEYFIIENRIKEGRDTSLPDEGMTIWLVDEFGSNNNEQMTPLLHYECSLKQADGRNDLEQGHNTGDGSDLFHGPGNSRFGKTTKPASNWWDGSLSGLELSQISTPGNSMNFMS